MNKYMAFLLHAIFVTNPLKLVSVNTNFAPSSSEFCGLVAHVRAI